MWNVKLLPPASATSCTHCGTQVGQRRKRDEARPRRTIAGSETIMWQSMKTPGTVLNTLASTGGPIVMFGTKWLQVGRSEVSARALGTQ